MTGADALRRMVKEFGMGLEYEVEHYITDEINVGDDEELDAILEGDLEDLPIERALREAAYAGFYYGYYSATVDITSAE